MDVECEANGHTESTVMDPSLSSHFIQPQIVSCPCNDAHTFGVALSSSVKPPRKPSQSRAPTRALGMPPASFNPKSPAMEINHHTGQFYSSIHVYKPRGAAVIHGRTVRGPMNQYKCRMLHKACCTELGSQEGVLRGCGDLPFLQKYSSMGGWRRDPVLVRRLWVVMGLFRNKHIVRF